MEIKENLLVALRRQPNAGPGVVILVEQNDFCIVQIKKGQSRVPIEDIIPIIQINSISNYDPIKLLETHRKEIMAKIEDMLEDATTILKVVLRN